MDRSGIEDIVLLVINTILKLQLKPEQKPDRKNTPGWDSLKHIEIMLALEEELEVEFSEDELVQLNSVDKIISAVLEKDAAYH